MFAPYNGTGTVTKVVVVDLARWDQAFYFFGQIKVNKCFGPRTFVLGKDAKNVGYLTFQKGDYIPENYKVNKV